MKLVALTLLTLLLAAVPTHAEPLGPRDECADQIYASADKTSCKRIDVAEAPDSVKDSTGKRLFLWLGPSDDESRSALTGSASLLGTLYGDSNGVKGLQREAFSLSGPRAPDNALLV